MRGEKEVLRAVREFFRVDKKRVWAGFDVSEGERERIRELLRLGLVSGLCSG